MMMAQFSYGMPVPRAEQRENDLAGRLIVDKFFCKSSNINMRLHYSH